MKKKWKRILSVTVLLAVLAVTYAGVSDLMIPKYYEPSELWKTTATIDGFYEMPEDTVDVLLLGSSQMVTAVSPMQMYHNYGITSYNLSMEQQNLLISYYWLEEALKYQSPEVVVLEPFFLFPFETEPPVNIDESICRKSLDSMKWSATKIQAVHDVCRLDESQSELSYYFPMIRFHDRWKNLEKSDFTYYFQDKTDPLRGYSMLAYSNDMAWDGFEDNITMESSGVVDTMLDYFLRIIELCRENDIELIVMKTPNPTEWAQADLNAVEQLAIQYEFPYIDLNATFLLDQIGWDNDVDYADNSHVSLYGAEKISNYLGDYLVKNSGTEDHRGQAEYADWDSDYEEYEAQLNDTRLKDCSELETYLGLLDSERYSIFLSVKDDASIINNDTVKKELETLGFQVDFNDCAQQSYVGVRADGVVQEKTSADGLAEYQGTLDSDTGYSLSSGGLNTGHTSSILIEGTEYSKNESGLNIVVYDNVLNAVVDQVCFGMNEEEKAVYR